jgi:hypothetical protein
LFLFALKVIGDVPTDTPLALIVAPGTVVATVTLWRGG